MQEELDKLERTIVKLKTLCADSPGMIKALDGCLVGWRENIKNGGTANEILCEIRDIINTELSKRNLK